MIQDPLLDTRGDADSLTIERSVFHRRRFSWKEGGRSLVARLSWDDEGRLTSREEEDQTLLYAYDAEGRETACYTLDTDGNVLIRDLKEWGDGPGPVRRRTKKRDSPDEEVWTCE